MKAYEVGDVARLLWKITSSTGSTVYVDPGGLTFHLTEPDHTTYSYVWGVNAQLATDGAGQFRVDWAVGKEGMHRGRWVASASHACAGQFEFLAIEVRTT